MSLKPLALMLLAVSLSLSPSFALARAGMGSSMGSRGSHTWTAPPTTRTNPYGAAPMQQSVTPGSSAYAGGYPGTVSRPHPFLAGLAGGLLGAGLFGLLFGHGILHGIHGLFGFIGFLIQLALIVFVVRWLLRRFTGRSGSAMPAFGQSRPNASTPIQITARDYQAFQKLLLDVQSAWSLQNIPALQGMATPEMVAYFNQQLSSLTSRGARNIVSDVTFLQGDLSEAWSENGYSYATVAMRYSLIDLTTDMMGRVIDGSSTEPVTVTELWTFVRPDRGGAWLLSAIQQGR